MHVTFYLSAEENPLYQFISPKPSSELVSIETNIILRYEEKIDRTKLTKSHIVVTGNKSGEHTGEITLAQDNHTILFTPTQAFMGDEKVLVSIKGVVSQAGSELPNYQFCFSTMPHYSDKPKSTLARYNMKSLKEGIVSSLLPAPPIQIDHVNSPSPGYIFLATWDRNVPAIYGNFIFVLDKNGVIVDSVRVNGAPYDFQIQPNGLLSYALGDFSSNVPLPGEELQHIVLNENLDVVDTFKMKNGYTTDFHEFKMLPNGHVMMMSYHNVPFDMSKIIEGGRTDATLVINIIQEQDLQKNVVFEWRNIDYIPITDSDLDLTEKRLNYSTLNAFDVDSDGNILASFRNHSEIMKISRKTGEILWRMGGPRGEFTFVGDHEDNAPYYFARQHNIRKKQNGNITLFDNGQFHQPPYSRAVEYHLDEVNKVATLVSEWRYPEGNIFCVTAGNADLLQNGGWFIGYGVPNRQFVQRNAVEVHPDGSIALELTLPEGVLAYRVTKQPWKETVDKPSFTHYEVREDNSYSFNNESIKTGVDLTYQSLTSPDYNEATITRMPYAPLKPVFIENNLTVYPVSVIYEVFAINAQQIEISFNLHEFPEILDPASTIVYYRPYQNQGLFIPLSTFFDDATNRLTSNISGVGEMAFGIPNIDLIANAPILYEPQNRQVVAQTDSVTIRWTGKGMYDAFHVQLSSDSTFSSTLYEFTTSLSDYSASSLSENTPYFWRVNAILDGQISPWSETWSFNLNGTTSSKLAYDQSTPGISLKQNFPNPFNSTTIITYTISTADFVLLKIVDRSGREVQTVVRKFQNAGTHSVSIQGDKLLPGSYFYELQVGSQHKAVRKMLLTK